MDYKKSHTERGENIGAYRVQSDNPAKNSSMVAYLGSKQFQAEYGLPATDFAKVMEDFRSKSVPGREPELKAAFVKLNCEVAALSLTPAYPGRSLAQSSKAQDLLKHFSHEASLFITMSSFLINPLKVCCFQRTIFKARRINSIASFGCFKHSR